MKSFTVRSRFILIAISGVMVAIWAICFGSALSWVNKPFPGFLIYRPPYVGSISVSDWPGRQAGLSFLERVVSANGKLVVDGQDVVSLAKSEKPGTQVLYQVESKGGKREVSVPVTIFSFKDFFLAFFVTFLGGVILYILGAVVVLLKPNIKPSWIFLALCSVVGGYMVTSFEILTTYIFLPFHYLALCFMPACFLHLALMFPERKRFLDRIPILEYAGYLPAVVLTIFYEIHAFTTPHTPEALTLAWLQLYKTLGTVVRVFLLFCVVSLFFSVCHSLYKASSPSARQRAKVILFGVTIAFLPSAAIMMAFYLMKVNFPWNFLVFFIIFFPASIAYSIIRHNLFDADAIIKRTVGYVIVTAVIVGAYVLVSIFFNVFLGQYQISQSKAFPIVFTVIIILIFNPLRNRIQSLVDRLFFRKEYDYGEIVEKVGDAMTSLLELPLILKRLVQTFMEDMFINTSSVMLLAPAGAEFQVFLAEGEQKGVVEKVALKQDNPLMEIIQREKRELTRYDVLEDPRYRAVSESCAADFARLNASLIIPLVYQNQVIGSLNLGEKKSGKPFKREDIDLLRSLAHQGAVAIENARLFKENLEKQRMEEELNIARDLQMSMLPASCPSVEGFQLAALSTPAREVGGDFFDFIEMKEGRLGLVVGDVTGKSVSGALVMAASRSVFRMLSEERLTVGEIMVRANLRTKKDIKKGMFVALLYAVLNSKDRVLSFCSAGQTQPIHFSPKTGKAHLVETEGDKFPLGILDEADYRDTRLELASGDKMVFYTDGIVEAMNEKKEIFGFERFLDVIQKAGTSPAEALLKTILNEVNTFVGTAEKHDDITIIVVAAE